MIEFDSRIRSLIKNESTEEATKDITSTPSFTVFHALAIAGDDGKYKKNVSAINLISTFLILFFTPHRQSAFDFLRERVQMHFCGYRKRNYIVYVASFLKIRLTNHYFLPSGLAFVFSEDQRQLSYRTGGRLIAVFISLDMRHIWEEMCFEMNYQ
jgi:hypothetical protein